MNEATWSVPWDEDGVTAVAFLGPGRLAAGNGQGRILLFDLPDGAAPVPVRVLEGHTNAVTALVAPGGRLVSASYDHTLRWWDAAGAAEGTAELKLGRKMKKGAPAPVAVEVQKRARVADAHAEWVRTLAAGTAHLLSGDDQGVAILWDAAEPREVRRLQVPGWLRAVALSPDSRLALTCEYAPRYAGFPNAIKLWDLAAGSVKADLSKDFKKGDRVTGMGAAAFSPDGKLVAIGQGGEVDGGAKAYLLDAETGKKLRELPGHQYGVTGLSFNPDGTLLASAGRDTVVRLWGVADGKLVKELGKPRGGQFKDWIHSAAFSPDGRRLAAGDMAGQLHLWAL